MGGGLQSYPCKTQTPEAYLPIVVVLVQSSHQHASGSSPLACQWQLSISMLVAILDKCYHQHASGSSPLACQWELPISMLVAMLDQCYHQHASGSSPLACQWQATTSMNFCTFKKNCATLNNFACGLLSTILQPAIKWDNDMHLTTIQSTHGAGHSLLCRIFPIESV